ncbi:family 10 glycosylhydrolase [Geitlerinema sp. PCC 7407]|uniref:glycoside hydrolase family 10 protein n=1 Tax=Geitlerinema sp. PCC 7407 TaxID=1173025 RepID=UPI00029FF804|nr:family 10 glycosylhydrolase [Geitlerinema sp. PCC 7407]AFY65445.1 protein of unknown function DUF187 [Geitlerinema sp. PCC 7407]
MNRFLIGVGRSPVAWFALSLLGAIAAPPALAQSQFADLSGHWGQACISQLAQKNILSGYPDGTFKPNATVTRAEFAAMVRRAFPNAANTRSASAFSDVGRSYWAHDAIQSAYRTTFLSGYPGNRFNPSQQIPRVQVLVSLASGLKATPSQPASAILGQALEDQASIPSYAVGAIAGALEKGWVVNYPNARRLNPNQPASRGEVAAFLCQALAGQSVPAALVPPQYIAKATSSVPNQDRAEIRGVWLTNIDSDVLFSRDRLRAALAELDRLNFNTVYPTVWNWGYTLYPSKVAESVTGQKLDPEPGLQGRDMLAEVVKEGRDRGLTVLPWFEFGFMAPADSQLAQRRSEWLTQRRDGSKIWMEGTHERVWLNPFRPEVQDFIIDLVVEIVRDYDVDGIQFDDHLGLPADLGYDPYTVALYKAEHQGQSPPSNPQDPEWVRWRAGKITEFMGRLFAAIKAEKPDAIVALSPNPQEFAYTSFLQDWQTWERRGYVEELMIQVYRNDLDRFQAEISRPEVQAARRHIPVGIGILSGLKGRNVPSSQIRAQVEAARQAGMTGVSFFFYETLWNLTEEPKGDRQSTLQTLFPKPVEHPKIRDGWQPQ